MLDRAKVVKALSLATDELFLDFSDEYLRAEKVWTKISQESTFDQKVKASQSPWLVPHWGGLLGRKYNVKPSSEYKVVAVDGSQIYPDRHYGASCFLVNVGIVHLNYSKNYIPAKMITVPYVFSMKDVSDIAESFSSEIVDCRRQELEFKVGIDYASKNPGTILLFDGSLIFWHLENYGHEIKQRFLSIYIALLERVYEKKIITASYISFPKSKELVNLIRLELCAFDHSKYNSANSVDHLVDSSIASFYLQEGQRSIVFKNNSRITKQYPEHLVPHFFYMNVGQEVGRVEFPAWIANDQSLVDVVASVCFDQSKKGQGYPVCLSEAHEQAVVKGADRDFFYYVLNQLSIKEKRKIVFSQKSLKKRKLGV